MRAVFACLLTVVGPGGLTLADEPRHRLIDLSLPDDDAVTAEAINNLGQVVGQSGSRAFLWEIGRGMIDLGTLGGHSSVARDVNDNGQVVGHSWTRQGSRRAFIWEDLDGDDRSDPGEMRELPPLPGFSESIAFAINGPGQVVGYSGGVALTDARRATLWEPDGEVRDLGAFGGSSTAFDINDQGVVAGDASAPREVRAWIWDAAAGMRELSGAVSRNSSARGISSLGHVVGHRNDIAFLWKGGRRTDLHGLLPNGDNGDEAIAVAVNESGQVVGNINYESEPGGRESAAFFWDEDGGLVVIDALLPEGFGTTEFAGDINDRGQIVGTYADLAGRRRAFLMFRDAPFSRGDANLDGAVNLTDAVGILRSLFQAARSPLPCEDAADSNDDGVLNLTDAVAVLGYLFRGGDPPPEPFAAACGQDPTPDSLACASSPKCP